VKGISIFICSGDKLTGNKNFEKHSILNTIPKSITGKVEITGKIKSSRLEMFD